ncbi:Protein kinase C-like phorbol ester/diacylglycerol-binding domain [Arabidopsis suecica]|uniref:Protein kinase C-like phorbol ester/diacylglycerol-binding domain n=1 Tax=Arabidopsis suecica TaxID=45249 RepID=A0A8T2DS93_ARASU|nr:Protein kinase C-like phorbol ester/diacylglycerol-binding domain [Arabidopsis suecica]
MSSVGVFSKKERDGKYFWVFTLAQTKDPTSSRETLAINSGGDDLPFQPLFFCPAARIKFQNLNIKEEDKAKCRPFNSSPHFPSTRSGDQQEKSLLDCDQHDICKLPVVPLFWCNNKRPSYVEFQCGACYMANKLSSSYFTCLQCQKHFHKECVQSPLEIKHPSHPFHPLRLYSYERFFKKCIHCEKFIRMDMLYHCITCDLSMHTVCAMRSIAFVVNHSKSHPHPLTFFPAQASLVCSFCAMIKKLDPTYVCIECVFAIHKRCMGFPHVIRISRHHHRISFTSSLPSGNLSCRACHQQVDNDYGAYACNKCDAYVVHSKCALNRNTWDGKDLEGIPEEEDFIDDGEPFERIADGIILHPFHSHQLQLEIFRAYDKNKYCQGCALPIYKGQFYSCMELECHYILHESCAEAPRKKRYPLYPHPLTLKVAMERDSDVGYFNCKECMRDGNGFFYEYRKEKKIFQLDLRCASIIEPFDYQGHQHPLFLPWDTEKKTRCQMCKYESKESKLICLECNYSICFSCVTFPYKARYKHDSHFLTICDGKEASDQPDWCEACECKIEEVKTPGYNGKNKKIEVRFYKCDDCCTTLHVECLLGADVYMKPGETENLSLTPYSFKDEDWADWIDVGVLPNSSLSRPICIGCKRRCPSSIFFKTKGDGTINCSMGCLEFVP